MVVIAEEPRRYIGITYVQPCDPTESYEFGAVTQGQFWLQTSCTSNDPFPILSIRINNGDNDVWQRLTTPGTGLRKSHDEIGKETTGKSPARSSG